MPPPEVGPLTVDVVGSVAHRLSILEDGRHSARRAESVDRYLVRRGSRDEGAEAGRARSRAGDRDPEVIEKLLLAEFVEERRCLALVAVQAKVIAAYGLVKDNDYVVLWRGKGDGRFYVRPRDRSR